MVRYSYKCTKGGIGMAFYFSKEERDKRLNEKENAKQLILKRKQEHEEFLKKREQELLDLHLSEMNKYCNWLNRKTNQFKNKLFEKGIKPTIGFELEECIDLKYGIGSKPYDEVSVFDIPSLVGLAFDEKSKSMIYYKCLGQFYDMYQHHSEPIYNYSIIGFDEIINVIVKVNSITSFESSVSNKSVIKRSVTGALLAGSAGSVIGGVTAHTNIKSTNLPKEIEISIQTTNENHRVISFVFDKNYLYPDLVLSDQALVDATTSTFKETDHFFKFKENKVRRKNGTYIDYIYYRDNTKHSNLEIIAEKLDYYAKIIETYIHEGDAKRNNNYSVADELSKLLKLKENATISDDEFNMLKKKIISDS